MQAITTLLLDGTSFVVTALASGAVVYFHDGKSLLLVVGALLSRSIVLCLKRVIKQPRPTVTRKKSEGFPSSHATLLSYFAFALSHARWSQSTYWQLFLAVSVFVLVGVRVVHGYHTTGQVVAGLALGTTTSWLWNFVSDVLMDRADLLMAYIWSVLTKALSS